LRILEANQDKPLRILEMKHQKKVVVHQNKLLRILEMKHQKIVEMKHQKKVEMKHQKACHQDLEQQLEVYQKRD